MVASTFGRVRLFQTRPPICFAVATDKDVSADNGSSNVTGTSYVTKESDRRRYGDTAWIGSAGITLNLLSEHVFASKIIKRSFVTIGGMDEGSPENSRIFRKQCKEREH